MATGGGGIGWGQRGKGGGGHESASNEGVLGREKPQIYGSHKLNSMLGVRADSHFRCQCKHEGRSESGKVAQGQPTGGLTSHNQPRSLDFTPYVVGNHRSLFSS